MNNLIYIANHGFPQVDPGPGVWDDAALHNAVTAAIGGEAEHPRQAVREQVGGADVAVGAGRRVRQ